jgi:alkanesulfonate monooxygenase
LEEQLAIITGLWGNDGAAPFKFAGKHYSVTNSPALPKPLQQPRPPVIVGGGGPSRTPRLAATYADEFNTPFLQPDDAGAQFARVRRACEAVDRDPESLIYSSAVMVCCGENEAEIARRAQAIGWSVEDARTYGAAGTPEEVVERVGRWRDAGASRIYFQVLDLSDLDHLRLIASEVVPQF